MDPDVDLDQLDAELRDIFQTLVQDDMPGASSAPGHTQQHAALFGGQHSLQGTLPAPGPMQGQQCSCAVCRLPCCELPSPSYTRREKLTACQERELVDVLEQANLNSGSCLQCAASSGWPSGLQPGHAQFVMQWTKGDASSHHYMEVVGATAASVKPLGAGRALITYGGHRCEDGCHSCRPFKECAACGTRKLQLRAVGLAARPAGAAAADWVHEKFRNHVSLWRPVRQIVLVSASAVTPPSGRPSADRAPNERPDKKRPRKNAGQSGDGTAALPAKGSPGPAVGAAAAADAAAVPAALLSTNPIATASSSLAIEGPQPPAAANSSFAAAWPPAALSQPFPPPPATAPASPLFATADPGGNVSGLAALAQLLTNPAFASAFAAGLLPSAAGSNGAASSAAAPVPAAAAVVLPPSDEAAVPRNLPEQDLQLRLIAHARDGNVDAFTSIAREAPGELPQLRNARGENVCFWLADRLFGLPEGGDGGGDAPLPPLVAADRLIGMLGAVKGAVGDVAYELMLTQRNVCGSSILHKACKYVDTPHRLALFEHLLEHVPSRLLFAPTSHCWLVLHSAARCGQRAAIAPYVRQLQHLLGDKQEVQELLYDLENKHFRRERGDILLGEALRTLGYQLLPAPTGRGKLQRWTELTRRSQAGP